MLEGDGSKHKEPIKANHLALLPGNSQVSAFTEGGTGPKPSLGHCYLITSFYSLGQKLHTGPYETLGGGGVVVVVDDDDLFTPIFFIIPPPPP